MASSASSHLFRFHSIINTDMAPAVCLCHRGLCHATGQAECSPTHAHDTALKDSPGTTEFFPLNLWLGQSLITVLWEKLPD